MVYKISDWYGECIFMNNKEKIIIEENGKIVEETNKTIKKVKLDKLMDSTKLDQLLENINPF